MTAVQTIPHRVERREGVHVLVLGWATNPVPANGQRGHWSTHARRVRAVRQTASGLAIALRAPAGGPLRLDHAEIGLTWYVTTKRRRDADNLVPLMKPLVDGLVDAHIVPDDNDDVVTRTMPRIVHEPAGPGRFELTIRPTERTS